MMKVYCIIVLLFLSISSGAQSTIVARKLGMDIIRAFKNQDVKILDSMILTSDEFQFQAIPIFAADTVHNIPSSMLIQSKQFYENRKQFQLNDTLFSRLSKEGIRLGIRNWNKIEFIDFQTDGRDNSTAVEPITFNGNIHFSCAGNRFTLFGITAVKLQKDSFRLINLRTIFKDN